MSESLTQTLKRTWDHIWFQDKPTGPLEVARIGIGLALLLHYSLAVPMLFTLYGDGGWLSLEALTATDGRNWSRQSIFFYLPQNWQLALFHTVFLFSCASLMFGWRTSWVKWIVLIGHISYAQRNPMLTYGVDSIAASILLLLCLAPVGRAMSLDRAREVRAFKRRHLDGRPPVFTSRWAFACRRLMQIQMAVLFLFSALHKVRAEGWWHGESIWQVFLTTDYQIPFMLDLLASNFWMVNIAVYGVVLVELAFPFLVWQKATRAYLLIGAIFIHLLFFFFLSLHYFSFVMIMGHMSFLRYDWLERLGQWWKRRTGEMEMIYDGHCGFCKRSMQWFLAFDGLGQIRTRDFRANPSSVVSDAEMEKALHLVLPDKRKLPGFEAYRYVVLRVPGLWWMVPFFYVPVLSRLIGTPIYNWVATNRMKVSQMLPKEAD